MARKQKPPEDEPPPVEETAAEVLARLDVFIEAQAAEIWSHQESDHQLTLEERLFVRSYVIDRNPVAAMRRLGHRIDDAKILKARADRYLSKAEVKNAIDYFAGRLMSVLEVTAEKVQSRIAAVAFFDPREVMQFDGTSLQLLNSKFWTREQAAVIQSVKMGKDGLEIKFYDGLRAAEMLAKQLGVQPEENDPAEQARLAADAAMAKIGTVLDRMFPGEPEPELKRIN